MFLASRRAQLFVTRAVVALALPTGAAPTLTVVAQQPSAGVTSVVLTTKGGVTGGVIAFSVRGTGCSIARAYVSASPGDVCLATANQAATATYRATTSTPLTLTFH